MNFLYSCVFELLVFAINQLLTNTQKGSVLWQHLMLNRVLYSLLLIVLHFHIVNLLLDFDSVFRRILKCPEYLQMSHFINARLTVCSSWFNFQDSLVWQLAHWVLVLECETALLGEWTFEGDVEVGSLILQNVWDRFGIWHNAFNFVLMIVFQIDLANKRS